MDNLKDCENKLRKNLTRYAELLYNEGYSMDAIYWSDLISVLDGSILIREKKERNKNNV